MGCGTEKIPGSHRAASHIIVAPVRCGSPIVASAGPLCRGYRGRACMSAAPHTADSSCLFALGSQFMLDCARHCLEASKNSPQAVE